MNKVTINWLEIRTYLIPEGCPTNDFEEMLLWLRNRVDKDFPTFMDRKYWHQYCTGDKTFDIRAEYIDAETPVIVNVVPHETTPYEKAHELIKKWQDDRGHLSSDNLVLAMIDQFEKVIDELKEE